MATIAIDERERLLRLRLLPSVRFDRHDAGGFVFCEETGAMFTVNATGAAVIDCLSRGEDEAAAATRLVARFDVPEAVARRDVERFLAALREHGLVAEE